jgi:hypothetical protein
LATAMDKLLCGLYLFISIRIVPISFFLRLGLIKHIITEPTRRVQYTAPGERHRLCAGGSGA